MRVVQRGNGTRLALETTGEFLARDLDGHGASQARIVRAEHLAHAAFTEQGVDGVRPDPCGLHWESFSRASALAQGDNTAVPDPPAGTDSP